MKTNTKKLLSLILTLLLISSLSIGCSFKKTVSPEETAQILFNFYIKDDKDALSKIGINKKQADETSKLEEKSFNDRLKMQFKSVGLNVSDDQVKQVIKAYRNAMKKVTATTEATSKTDDAVEVKIKSTYINSKGIDEKASKDAINEVMKSNLQSEKERKTKVTNDYINNLIKGFENAKASTDKKEKTFKFVKKDGYWLPQNMYSFGLGIADFVTGAH